MRVSAGKEFAAIRVEGAIVEFWRGRVVSCSCHAMYFLPHTMALKRREIGGWKPPTSDLLAARLLSFARLSTQQQPAAASPPAHFAGWVCAPPP